MKDSGTPARKPSRQEGKNAGDMRVGNALLIIRLLGKKKLCSRAEIARQTGLTQAAITYITRDLIEAGLVTERGSVPSDSKRPAVGLSLNNDFCTVSILIDRSIVRTALVGIDGTVLTASEKLFGKVTPCGTLLREANGMIAGYLTEYGKSKRILGIGAAVPGPYIPKTGKFELVSGAPGWESIDIRRELSSFGLPVFIEHNANCGALAELWYNEAYRQSDLLYVIGGYGVGAGLILDGRLFRGHIGTAGEIGHLSLDVNGPPCECGGRGCMELYCTVKTAAERYNRRKPGRERTPEEVLRLAEEGDADARAALLPLIGYLAKGLAGVTNILGEEVVILSGMLAEAGKFIVPRLEEEMKRYLLPSIADSVSVFADSRPKDETILIGASANVIGSLLQQKNFSDFVRVLQKEGTQEADGSAIYFRLKGESS